MSTAKTKNHFEQRLEAHYDELKWLYCELYNNDMGAFEYFLEVLRRSWKERKRALRMLDDRRVENPDWYRGNDLLGMMLYTDRFAGNLKGVEEKLPYLRECGVNYLHLMPLLESPKGKSDGGYAVSDFRKVQPELGTMEDLEALADTARKKGVRLCLDFVMNHTSEDHAWAKAARAGDQSARDKYFFYDNWDIPNEYEKTVPQVFPTTAPGNFTYLEDCGQVVMTFFYPYQWDLNYANPMVFNDMTENLLYLANRGIDVIRLDAIPYIWKALGTDCRNQPKVHTLARMLNLACRIVCPGVLLLGEVVMEPAKLAPYFGTTEKPECHVLYNATTMCTTWHTVATGDVRLLKEQTDRLCALPHQYLFQNYLRCHDDIGWGLDFPWLSQFGMAEIPHKKYLNDYFTGNFPGSPSRGETYNDDPTLGDARMCGTTASLCGLESALESGDADAIRKGIDCDLMLHAWVLSQSGIPVLYSGDEVAALNDYSYHDDPELRDDSRYVHRGFFDWARAEDRKKPETPAGEIFAGLRELETIRAKEDVFRADADVATLDTGSDAILGISRSYDGKTMYALFNFSPEEVTAAALPACTDMRSGEKVPAGPIALPAWGFRWLMAE